MTLLSLLLSFGQWCNGVLISPFGYLWEHSWLCRVLPKVGSQLQPQARLQHERWTDEAGRSNMRKVCDLKKTSSQRTQ